MLIYRHTTEDFHGDYCQNSSNDQGFKQPQEKVFDIKDAIFLSNKVDFGKEPIKILIDFIARRET